MSETPAAPYVPAFLPQGPAPAHTLTIAVHAHPLGGFDVDARCSCNLLSYVGTRLRHAAHGWSALYGAEDDGPELRDALSEARRDWTTHREACAELAGPAVLL